MTGASSLGTELDPLSIEADVVDRPQYAPLTPNRQRSVVRTDSKARRVPMAPPGNRSPTETRWIRVRHA
ncbi:hypothetical protein [Natrinema soli]|uniref:Uncharacterized protein n=1 Tax=Natrinema soli TaxID=1930624 RepID=A0ABD5SFG1_9EURY|nr:hypothetical protein [Natrinema soli]